MLRDGRKIVIAFTLLGLLLSGCSNTSKTNAPTTNTSASPANARVTPGSSTPTARTTSAAASKDGWWIKVRKEKQESPTITFFIGSNNHTVEAWKTWNSGDDLEFDVPDKFKNINPLYIKAQSSGGRNSWFCMMYKGDGVKHFDFDDDEDHEEKQSNRDDECNFSN